MKVRVGDVVFAGLNAFKVTGIYLGGVNTQNLIGLQSMFLARGAANGSVVQEMLVPEELVGLSTRVYRHVDSLDPVPLGRKPLTDTNPKKIIPEHLR